jgi:hypothetical protein
MVSYAQCANNAIRDFLEPKDDSELWPNWPPLIPGGSPGWGATADEWNAQAHVMIRSFEVCCSVKITCSADEIENLRLQNLTVFKQYVVEKAEHAGALLAVKMAQLHLRRLKLTIRTFTP